jgi:phenylacetate-CoA ligase
MRCVLEVVGRMKEAIYDGQTYLFPVYFQDLLVGVRGVSPIHRVSISGEERPTITLDVQLTDPRHKAASINEIERRAKELTSLTVDVRTHAWGQLFESVYSQQQFRNVQTAKTMAFHDTRKGEFLVTY